MDAVAPGITEGFDLFGFAADVVFIAVFDVTAGGGPLEVGVEFDAVGRVDINALDLAAESFAFGEACHDLEAVAEDHAIGPIGVMLVELGPGGGIGEAVEVGEEVGLRAGFLIFSCLALPEEVVDEDLGMDFFLDIKGRGLGDEVRPILLIFPAPDELRVEIAVAAFIGNLQGAFVGVLHDGLMLDGGDILTAGLVMAEGLDRL